MSSNSIAFVSLGCDKNRLDTENMLYYLSRSNFTVTDDFSAADIIIVNTCAFIESARKEAIDTVFEMAEYKKTGKCKKLIVTGCLVQKYRDQLQKELPEVDAFLGTEEYEKIASVIDPSFVPIPKCGGRILTTPAHYAYIKVAEGCDRHCTFCTIPSIRGKYKSRSMEEIVSEAEYLCNEGVKEIILVAQDTTSYGIDLYGEYKLTELLKKLAQIDFTWIRLMYCYPELVSDELIKLIADEPKIAKYIDMPIQHSDDKILRLMGRRGRHSDIVNVIEKLKAANPEIAIRTTLMVGFPGEGEAEFENLCAFTQKYKLDNVGIFAYSREEGTASYGFKEQVTKSVKAQRVKKLGEINFRNISEKNDLLIGKTVDVIYEDIDYDKKLFKGRTQQNAPEIDRYVYFFGNFADVGNVYKVKITGSLGYDLKGELV